MTHAMDLAVLIPTRGRPEAAEALEEVIAETSRAETHAFFLLDKDDPTLEEYARRARVAAHRWVNSSSGMVAALNRGAATARYLAPALAFMGDDHRPRTPGWDVRLLEALEELGTGFAYGNDLLQGEAMPTAIAMTSDIVRALGYMAPPALGHLNVDIAWLEWGRRLDRIRYLEDVVIEHLHPANGKAELDEGYLRVNSGEQVWRDGEAYAAYLRDDLEDDLEKLRGLIGART